MLKSIKGYKGLYRVSSKGYVTNGRITLKTYTINSGYECLKLHDADGVRKSFLLHRLVAEAFVPNPNKLPEVNHIDGDKKNNAAENLEWVDSKGNKKHAKDTGLWKHNKPSLGIKIGKTSKYRGVGYDKARNKFYSSVRANNVDHFRKRFSTEIEAAKHYDWIIDHLKLKNRPKNFS